MNRPALRALVLAAALAAAAPTALLLPSLHPAGAATPPAAFGQYALTSTVRASSTDGVVGASGGLAPLDSGSASVDASLDANPSAMVLARPVEPGTFFATVNSQLGAHAVAVPEAQAAYPGTTPTASTAPTPASTAHAAVTPTSATGAATTAGASETGLTLGATTATTALSVTGGGHQVNAVADSYASGFDVGVLAISGVAGHAAISATDGGARTVTAVTTVVSASVAGQAVVVDGSGVRAVGTTIPLGPTLAQETAVANAALASAGIRVSLAAPVKTTGSNAFGEHAAADSGGLSVTLTTPGTAALPGNTVTVTLGRVEVTEADAPGYPATAPATATAGGPVPAAAGSPGSPAVPGTAGTVVTVGQAPAGLTPPPALAARGARRTVTVVGYRLSARTALAALGGWQAITLGVATFGVLALRRPREPEESLCPCP